MLFSSKGSDQEKIYLFVLFGLLDTVGVGAVSILGVDFTQERVQFTAEELIVLFSHEGSGNKRYTLYRL